MRVKQLQLFGREIEANQWRRELLNRLDGENETELADRLRKCGLEFALYCRTCGHKHVASVKCCRKWCPSCAPKRANERARKMRMAVRLMKWPMHVTLTMRNVPLDEAPRSILRDLLKSFQKLRRMEIWKANVVGGCRSIEITDKGNGLHPHIHCLIDCEWLAVNTPAPRRGDSTESLKVKFRCAAMELQKAWMRCLQQDVPPSLWIRRCDAGAADEVMKYALKSEDAVNCQGRIGPVLRMLDSIRTVATFGSLRGMKLPDDDGPGLECPSGHRDWSPSPPMEARDTRTAAQKLRDQRAAEFDAKCKSTNEWAC